MGDCLSALLSRAAEFEEDSSPTHSFVQNYTRSEGLRYAQLSNLAYYNYDKVKEELSKYNLKAVARINDDETDTEGFIATDSDEKYIIVAFRGTESSEDIIRDISIESAQIIPGQEPVGHSGFVKALSSVYEQVEKVIKPDVGKKEIYITGHSLGGALASLLVYRLAVTYPESRDKMTMFVYGCPPVGDKTFEKVFEGLRSYVITCEDDPVSHGIILELPYFKPSSVELLPGGEHFIKLYMDTMKQLPDSNYPPVAT